MAVNKTKSLKSKELGNSGVFIQGGRILNEDYNSQLNGKQAIKVYEQMRRSDATVNAALEAIKLPIQSADFEVDPASDDEVDHEIAAEINDQFDHLLDAYLVEALTYLDFGYCVHEMVFEPMDILGRTRLGVSKLGYRKQTTIDAWETEDHQPGITQLDQHGKYHSIPEVKLIRLTRKQEGDNYQGISILRTAYRHWYIKDKLYKIDAVGHERHALGVLDVAVPTGANDKDKKKMRQLARNLRANEEAYLEHPVDWVVSFLDNKASSMRDVEPSINHHDRQIMKNVLAQFLEIGSSGSSGTRSVSEDQSRLFELAVQSVAKYIVSVLQNTFVKSYMDLNYTDRDHPKLRVANLADDNIPIVSEAVAKFVTAGVLHPTKGDENTIRRMVGFIELAEEELDEVYEKAEQEKKAAAEKTAALKQAKDDVDEDLLKAHALHASITRKLYDRPARAA